MEDESDGDTNRKICARHKRQSIGTRTGGLVNKRTSGYHSNYNIVEIGQDTKKSPGDLKWLTVVPTPVENHQLTLVWRTVEFVKL